MKSWKGILLALLILASFAGCSRSATSTPEDSAAESQSAQAETSTEAESTEAEQPEPEPLPTFTFGGVEFYPILLSEDTLTSLDTTEGTLPGERSETVSEIKAALFATYGLPAEHLQLHQQVPHHRHRLLPQPLRHPGRPLVQP